MQIICRKIWHYLRHFRPSHQPLMRGSCQQEERYIFADGPQGAARIRRSLFVSNKTQIPFSLHKPSEQVLSAGINGAFFEGWKCNRNGDSLRRCFFPCCLLRPFFSLSSGGHSSCPDLRLAKPNSSPRDKFRLSIKSKIFTR